MIGVAIAAFGLVMVVVADRMAESLVNDYLLTDMTYDEYVERLDTIDAVWTIGVIAIALSVVVVGLAVPVNDSSAFEKMRKKLETDFYRKCPGCGSWNTKLVQNCTTCGILLPRLQESTRVGPEPSVFKNGP